MIDFQKSKRKYTFKDITVLLSIFMILYVNNSYNSTIMQGTVVLGVSIGIAIFQGLLHLNMKINGKLLLTTWLLLLNVIITSISTGDNIKDITIMISVIIASFIIVSAVNVEEYFDKYNKVLYIISLFSVIVYFTALLFPNIIRMFPEAYYRPTQEVYNLGLSFMNLRPSLIRNMGIFWEPGVFQTYLVIAILGEIFLLRNKKRYIIIFSLALLTTWSTTGLISGLILIVIFTIHHNPEKGYKYLRNILFLILGISVLFIVYSFLPYQVRYALFGKITVFLNSDRTKVTSAYVRLTSTTYPMKAFFGSPFVGVGYNGLTNSILSAGHTMVTNTPVNWFTAYGIIFGTICSFGVYGLSSLMNRKANVLKLLIIIVLLLSMVSEQYLRNTSVFIFLIYGIEHCLSRSNKKVFKGLEY